MTTATRFRGVPRPRAARDRSAEPGPGDPSGRRVPTVVPAAFARAVRSMRAATARPDVTVVEERAPQRLAPWAFAVAVDVLAGGTQAGTGRLVLLHDPAAPAGWGGVLRVVAFASADLDAELAADPLLPEVCWSWLGDALAAEGAGHAAASGTVTCTTSTRFGAGGPAAAGPGPADCTVELRASWTPTSDDLGAHLRAFADLLCTAAGLPPAGVTALPGR